MKELHTDIHVWQAKVSEHLDDIERLKNFLSVDERDKAARFVTEQLSQHYIVAHGLLREVLAKYISVAPEKLMFSQGAHGKPYLDGKDIFFNMSHAGDRVVYAVTTTGEVGVDVEMLDRNVDYFALAKRFFTEAESEQLGTLDGKALQTTFFAYWTRKEAYLKMLGKGLVQPLSSIDVRANLFNENEGYRISDVDVGNGYLAALAYPWSASDYKFFNLK